MPCRPPPSSTTRNRPRLQGLPGLLLLGSVIVTALPGCDNVQWGGMEISLQPPDPPPSALVEPEPEPDEDAPLLPVETGPLLYLVEREGSGAGASLLPVARITSEGFEPLPTADDTPDLLPRFPLERWEAGTEFLLLDRGRRAGTLIADGSVTPDERSCQLRPRGAGRLELRPEAQGAAGARFLAVRKADLGRAGLTSVPSGDPGTWPAYPNAAELRSRALSAARYAMQRAGVPWPPSLPDIVRDHRGVALPDGEIGLAATYTFGGDLEVGPLPPTGYGLFVVARLSEGGNWVPVWLWHQMGRQGKAFPRVLAEGGLDPERGPEILLEVLGTDRRWLALLGEGSGGWDLLYQDPCGDPPARGAARPWP